MSIFRTAAYAWTVSTTIRANVRATLAANFAKLSPWLLCYIRRHRRVNIMTVKTVFASSLKDRTIIFVNVLPDILVNRLYSS